jgi:hypothetical protein
VRTDRSRFTDTDEPLTGGTDGGNRSSFGGGGDSEERPEEFPEADPEDGDAAVRALMGQMRLTADSRD